MNNGELMQDKFALKLIALRKNMGWTQEILADKCGVSRQAVAKWEGGQSLPDIFRLVELADLFQVDINEILPDTDSSITMKCCIEALGDMYPMVMLANLSKNTYSVIKCESDYFNGGNIRNTYDEMLEEASRRVPDVSQRVDFVRCFKRENLIKAYGEGKRLVSQGHKQLDSGGNVFWVGSSACFIRDVKQSDVVVIILSRSIDRYIRKEEEDAAAIKMRQSIIDVLTTEYNAVYLSNLETGQVLYAYTDNAGEVDDLSNDAIKNFTNCFEAQLDDMYMQIIHPEDLEQFKHAISKEYVSEMLAKQDAFSCNYRMLIGDKTIHYQTKFLRSIDFETSNNFIVALRSIEESFTEINKQKENFEALLEEMKKGSETKSNLIMQMSHDVRTPLNSIMGFLNLAGNSKTLEDKDDYIKMATDACNNMTYVLNEILGLITVEGSNVIVNRDETSIKKLLNYVISTTNDMAEKLGIEPLKTSEDVVTPETEVCINFDGKRVLLVEDTEANAMVTTAFLKDWNVIVDRAHDGVEGVEYVMKSADKPYDIILMDVQMPNMNGYEATKIIRSLAGESAAEVPIIALTANAFDEDKKIALEAGMNAYLCKPFTPKALNDILKEYVPGGR